MISGKPPVDEDIQVSVRIKIEGITSLADARAAIRYGADALGLVFAKSPRRIDVKKAKRIVANLGPFIQTVGLFVDPTIDEIVSIGNAVGFSHRMFQIGGTPPWGTVRIDYFKSETF